MIKQHHAIIMRESGLVPDLVIKPQVKCFSCLIS